MLFEPLNTSLKGEDANKLRKYSIIMGDRLADYEMGELIGKGAFGSVYKAKSKHTKQVVAIKMIEKNLIKSHDMEERVQSEMQIQLRLKHPSIVELYLYFEDKTHYYLVMEYCERGELYKYLRKTKIRLTETQTKKFIKQIALGIKYLHHCGIIHRDIKLANLLLTKDFRVKIGDFGLAASLSGPDEERYTQLGTPNFVAPEIVEKRAYGQKVDLWSLGCVLYNCLVGKPPFQEEHVEQTIERIKNPYFTIPNDISETAQDLIRKLLLKDAELRLSIDEVLRHPFLITNEEETIAEQCNNQSLNSSTLSSNSSNTISNNKLEHNKAEKIEQHSTVNAIPVQYTTSTTKIGLKQQSTQPNNKKPSNNTLICTERLKPILHSTKHGIIEISSRGEVSIKFRKTQDEFKVSSDGLKVFFTSGAHSKEFSYSTQEIFSHSAHEKLLKYYQYALNFVNLVRCKTPKICLYTSEAKCILMENNPGGDVEIVFYDGNQIIYERSKRVVTLIENATFVSIHLCKELHLEISSIELNDEHLSINLTNQNEYSLFCQYKQWLIKLKFYLLLFEKYESNLSSFPSTLDEPQIVASFSELLALESRKQLLLSSVSQQQQQQQQQPLQEHSSLYSSGKIHTTLLDHFESSNDEILNSGGKHRFYYGNGTEEISPITPAPVDNAWSLIYD